MNVPHNALVRAARDDVMHEFEWTNRPGEILISESDWDAVKEYAKLSNRENQVCRLLFEWRKRDEIAEILCISPRTVRFHLETLHKKLKVHTRVGLVLRIIQLRDYLIQAEVHPETEVGVSKVE